MKRLLLVLLLMSIAGCTSGEDTLVKVDPDAVAEVPSWSEFYNVIQRECAPCHDGAVEPELVDCDDIIDELGAITDQVLVKNTMPPGAWPRLTSEEKLIITRYNNNYLTDVSVPPCED